MVENARHEFGEFFVFACAVDGECVGGDGGVDYFGKVRGGGFIFLEEEGEGWRVGDEIGTFRGGEMDHVAVFFEHVDFIYYVDRLHVEFFERALEFFVVGAGGFVDFF